MDLSKNAKRFTGKSNVETYDFYRPKPPEALVELANVYAGERTAHVMDVGCGSGLSSEIWLGLAEEITCVDPSVDMLRHARDKFAGRSEVNFVEAYSHDIPWAANSIDVLTCSQCFHWMDPQVSLDEFNRLLRPGGVLVIYDCVWPPSVNQYWESAFVELFDNILEISKKQKEPLMHFWDKNKHVKNLVESGHFEYIKEVEFHKERLAEGDYFIGLAESQGGIQAMRKLGVDDDENGWNKFVETIKRRPLKTPIKFVLHYRAIYAINKNE